MKSWKNYPKEANSEEAEIKLDDCENKTVYFKAKQGNVEGNPNLNGLCIDEDIYHYFVIKGSIKADGNIQFLLENTGTKMDVPMFCYNRMFQNCTSLTQAPTLPATTLADGCYANMFSSCTSLIQAPALPAETLADYCYNSMFYDCSSLTQAPELPAKTLAHYCYFYMFCNCTSLTQAPTLPAETLASYCYDYMFNGCPIPEPKFIMPNLTFDEVANAFQDIYIFTGGGKYEIQCSDKILVATYDYKNYEWIITEK